MYIYIYICKSSNDLYKKTGGQVLTSDFTAKTATFAVLAALPF